jgi:hypothetical protein
MKTESTSTWMKNDEVRLRIVNRTAAMNASRMRRR